MKRSRIFISLGVLFIVFAVALTGYNLWSDWNGGNTSRSVLKSLTSQIEQPSDVTNSNIVPDYVLNPQMEMPVKEVEGGKYVGYLDIPTLGVQLPVHSRLTDSNLNTAPCRYKGSVYQDNMIIAAHNFISHFGYLSRLSIGDVFTFTDIDGNVFSYEVMDMEQLRGEQVEDMSSGEWDMTLFTCTFDGGSRVTVRCKKISEE